MFTKKKLTLALLGLVSLQVFAVGAAAIHVGAQQPAVAGIPAMVDTALLLTLLYLTEPVSPNEPSLARR